MLTAADRTEIRTLLIAAIDGHRAALEPLFARLWPVTRAYCRHFLRGDDLADDAAQDAMIAVFRRMAEFDPERDALAWVLGIATWQCRTLTRRRWRRGEAALGPAQAGTVDGAAIIIERDLVAAALVAVASLPATDVATLTAAIVDDEAPAGLPPATFRKRLERARLRVRLAWRSRHGTS